MRVTLDTRTDTPSGSQRPGQHVQNPHSLSHMVPTTEKGKWTWAPIPHLGAILNQQPLTKGKKIVFFNGVSLDINHVEGQAPCPAVDGLRKMNSIVLL